MAGTFAGVALTQQNDLNGNPMAGARLSVWVASTSTPQLVYQDVGLTLPLPWPLVADAGGRFPMMFAPDGYYRLRLEDSAGLINTGGFDYPSVPSIGPSTTGSSSGSVDPSTVFQTGDVIWFDQSGARTGWVRDNGRSIGSAVSGASERANSDTSALFSFLWTTYADAVCPVSGGRGATAAADFAANKTITLPDKRGYVPGGLPDMGNVDSGAYTGVPVVSGSATAAGGKLGAATHVITQAQLPSVTLSTTIAAGQGTHYHNVLGQLYSGGLSAGGQNYYSNSGVGATPTDAGVLPQLSGTTPLGGSGSAHNNTPLTVLGTFYRKL